MKWPFALLRCYAVPAVEFDNRMPPKSMEGQVLPGFARELEERPVEAVPARGQCWAASMRNSSRRARARRFVSQGGRPRAEEPGQREGVGTGQEACAAASEKRSEAGNVEAARPTK